jgi:hypothetical protein
MMKAAEDWLSSELAELLDRPIRYWLAWAPAPAPLSRRIDQQAQAFYDLCIKRGNIPWPVSSANWRRSWPPTLSATPA